MLYAAYREVERTLIAAGSERAKGAATQIAALLERAASQGLEQLRTVGSHPNLIRYLQEPTPANRETALAVFARLPGSASRRFALWNNSGTLTLELLVPGASSSQPAHLPAIAEPPRSLGLMPFQSDGHGMFADTVVGVGDTWSQEGARTLGYLVVRSTFSVSPPDSLTRLVGSSALVAVGNRQDGVWSDLSRLLPAPPVDLTRDGTTEYSRDGSRRVGALAGIRGSPWAVWVEFPESSMLAQAHSFLTRMSGLALLLALVGAIAVRSASGRITRPLTEMTEAADAIVRGDYSHRVKVGRDDEIGRLGQAFNTMTGVVQQAKDGLEARVRESAVLVDALSEREAYLRAIVDVAFDCIITVDAKGIVSEFNPAAEKTFGYTRDEAVGRELADLIVPPSMREAHRNGLARFLTTSHSAILGKLIELTAMRSDRSLFPVELVITAVGSEGPPRFTGFIRDITRRKEAEAALLESESRTQFALAAAHAGIWELDVANDRVAWSPTMAAVFGRSADLVPKTTQEFIDLIHADDRPGVADAFQQAIVHGNECETEFRVVWPDGSVHWIYCRARVTHSVDGTANRILGIAMDIRERKSLEAQLRQAQKMEAVGQLAGGVAHDFNNLLTAILGYANLVADNLDQQDPLRNDVEEIRKAGERAAGLTRQLLAFSRKQVLQPAILDLNALITDTCQMLSRLIGEHIHLETRLAPDLAPIHADASQIEQIVLNLAVNARDAMPNGGRLTIETANITLDDSYRLQQIAARPGSYVQLSVTDTGTGMSEETMQRLFEPFFTTKEFGRGTGLGLAMVYGIVKQSGGSISVYSERDKGATFKVFLPQAEAPRGARVPASVAASPPAGSETVLLVEDEEAVRFLVRTLLERAGYQVFVADDPAHACRLFEQHESAIEMLITDVVMPGSTGPALFERLSKSRPSLKVLYMSGYTDDAVVRDDRPGPPAVAFLQKPFSADRLLRKVREAFVR